MKLQVRGNGPGCFGCITSSACTTATVTVTWNECQNTASNAEHHIWFKNLLHVRSKVVNLLTQFIGDNFVFCSSGVSS